MKEFTFEPKTHTYRLDGKRMTGVTTVLGVIAKPALISWAAKMAVEYVKDKMLKADGNLKPLDVLENLPYVLEQAKKAHIMKRDSAAQKGTDVHGEIEGMIKRFMKSDGIAKVGEKFENKQLQHFYDWAFKNKVKFLESEKQVYSARHFIAGTFDGICVIDGKRMIFDIKTSKAIWNEAFYQMAAYKMMLEEMGEPKLDGSFVIRLGKDGKFNQEKDVQFRYDHTTDLKAFLGALDIYRANATFAQHYKR